MHRAMEVYGGDFFVRVQNVPDVLHLFYVRRTLVVNDDVITFGPVGLLINVEASFGGGVRGMDLVDLQVRARFESLLEQVLLLSVVMAASACDQQRSEWFGSVGGRGGTKGNGQ